MRKPAAEAVAPATARPLVSVVVPAYNAAWSIDQTLASVCAQTYPNFEVLVVDDGSTDATAEAVGAWTVRDPRVRLLRKPNGGVASARNLGVREARGAYVAPIDSDDLWAPDNLDRQVSALEAAGPGAYLSFARTVYVDPDGVPMPSDPPKPPQVDFRGLLLRNSVANGSAAVFRRDRLIEAGGYDEGLRAAGGQGAEDWKLILTLAARGQVVHVPVPTVHYRICRDSMSHAVPIMRRGALMVIAHVRRHGPRMAPWTYWHARTLMMTWMLPRALQAHDWREAAGLAARAYLLNPFWWVNPEPRGLIRRILWAGLRKGARRLSGRRTAAGAEAKAA
ncbi:glycosyltransferase family 2 protein [Caulobacter sp. 17J65-9]|uniref:glycosyltransferase family 2 protein n=1 Tax=Caulobacter sp. 17J65-9 TaxID=2709382 RepID=UPI0013CA2544|nr:glycosyltransferase family 2 protein [Caulobacter sp. 17J65-9]NEX93042.1 glycosyltransferase family 2 protein [Caulobacter sp. 17J65-9]